VASSGITLLQLAGGRKDLHSDTCCAVSFSTSVVVPSLVRCHPRVLVTLPVSLFRHFLSSGTACSIASASSQWAEEEGGSRKEEGGGRKARSRTTSVGQSQLESVNSLREDVYLGIAKEILSDT
jgi:hypothetical protein